MYFTYINIVYSFLNMSSAT